MMTGLRMVLGLLMLLAPVSGCGSSGIGPTDCCNSGAFYSCNSNDQVQSCVVGQPHGCVRDATRDNYCQTP